MGDRTSQRNIINTFVQSRLNGMTTGGMESRLRRDLPFVRCKRRLRHFQTFCKRTRHCETTEHALSQTLPSSPVGTIRQRKKKNRIPQGGGAAATSRAARRSDRCEIISTHMKRPEPSYTAPPSNTTCLSSQAQQPHADVLPLRIVARRR